MGKMKEIFMEKLRREQISAEIPSEDDAVVFLSVVKNHSEGTLIKVGAFHSFDTARQKGRDYVNRKNIDTADVEVYAMTWSEINGHM